MQMHRTLTERLDAVLGPSQSDGEAHIWNISVGEHTVNIRLDLPEPQSHIRLWVFDPRRNGLDCARFFKTDTQAEVDLVLAVVTALSRERPPGPSSARSC